MTQAMTTRQHLFAVAIAVALLVFVVELVRRRRLREEYSWLWMLASATIVLLAAWENALGFVTRLTGAVVPITAMTILGILFLMVVCIHLCVKLTEANQQTKRLAQEVAIISARLPDPRTAGTEPSDPHR